MIEEKFKSWWPAEIVKNIDFAKENPVAMRLAFENYQKSGHNAQARVTRVKTNRSVTDYFPTLVLYNLSTLEHETIKKVKNVLEGQRKFAIEEIWVNARDDQGSSLLEIFGAERGELERVKQLIEAGADSESIRRTFIRACSGPHLAVAKYLWANHHGECDLVNALVGAAGHQNKASMKWLFEIGADKFKFKGGKSFLEIIQSVQEHHADEFNNTPALLMAAHYSHIEACKHLLKDQFHPTILLAAFDTAAAEPHTHLLPLLAKQLRTSDLENRLLAMATAGNTNALGAILSKAWLKMQRTMALARQTLIRAAENNQSGVIRLLVERGVKINCIAEQSTAEPSFDHVGNALRGHKELLAALSNNTGGAVSLEMDKLSYVVLNTLSSDAKHISFGFKSLVNKVNKVNKCIAEDNKNDILNLIRNQIQNIRNARSRCLEEGPRLPEQPKAALSSAASLGHAEAVLTLLSLGATNKKKQALCSAQKNKRLLVVEILGGEKAPNKEGELVKAVSNGHIRLATYLLEQNKSDINETDNLGQTALMHAAYRGCQQSINLLLEAGADIDAQLNDESTAYSIATAKGHSEIAAQLKPSSNLPYYLLAGALILVSGHQLWHHWASIQTLFNQEVVSA